VDIALSSNPFAVFTREIRSRPVRLRAGNRRYGLRLQAVQGTAL